MILLLLAYAGAVPSAYAVDLLTQVEPIRSLSREVAARALPVKLTGVVIYTGWSSLVLHDGKAAIFLDFGFAKDRDVWKGPLSDFSELKSGTGLEIEGVTDAGGWTSLSCASV